MGQPGAGGARRHQERLPLPQPQPPTPQSPAQRRLADLHQLRQGPAAPAAAQRDHHGTITYDYAGLQRLTSAKEHPGSTQTYTYDLAGNRTGVWLNGTHTQNLTYNAANQVNGWSYDTAGNLLNDGTTAYTYDALGRVLSVGTTSNSYNTDGTLVAQTQNGVTTRYVQDLAAPLSHILSDGTQRYVYGNPAEQLFGATTTTKTWYRTDALGSVRATLSDAGIPQSVANYDAWGVPETPSMRHSAVPASCSVGTMGGCGRAGTGRGGTEG